MPPASDATSTIPADSRPCLGCGYDLRGLGDEPRCPECGLLNVPQGYREEVWKQVDSGKWFFSGFFHPFKKRLPGWWWSLDRPRDVRASRKAVLRNAVLAAMILIAGCLAIDLFRVQTTTHWFAYDPNSPERKSIDLGSSAYVMTFTREELEVGGKESKTRFPDFDELMRKGLRANFADSHRVVMYPRTDVLFLFAPHMFIAIVLIWAYPATVGFLTQVRKSLPAFARPKRTIVAAANQESHHMIYNAVVAILIIFLIYAFHLRDAVNRQWQRRDGALLLVAYGGMALIAAVRWFGPVRSDYTRQLIQSRLQAVRIVFLYGLVFPWATTLAILLLATALRGRELCQAWGI